MFSLFAQDLEVEAKVGNPSKLINDGFIDLEVTGGLLLTVLNGMTNPPRCLLSDLKDWQKVFLIP